MSTAKKRTDSSFSLITALPTNNIINVDDTDANATRRITFEDGVASSPISDLSATGTPTNGDTVETILGKLANATGGITFASAISGLGSETGQVADADTLLEALAKINDRLALSGGTLTGDLTVNAKASIVGQNNSFPAATLQQAAGSAGTSVAALVIKRNSTGWNNATSVGVEWQKSSGTQVGVLDVMQDGSNDYSFRFKIRNPSTGMQEILQLASGGEASFSGPLGVNGVTPPAQAAYIASPTAAQIRDIFINLGFMAAS